MRICFHEPSFWDALHNLLSLLDTNFDGSLQGNFLLRTRMKTYPHVDFEILISGWVIHKIALDHLLLPEISLSKIEGCNRCAFVIDEKLVKLHRCCIHINELLETLAFIYDFNFPSENPTLLRAMNYQNKKELIKKINSTTRTFSEYFSKQSFFLLEDDFDLKFLFWQNREEWRIAGYFREMIEFETNLPCNFTFIFEC